MLVDYSSDENGTRHKLVVKYSSGRIVVNESECTFERFYDENAVFFTLPAKCYIPEDCRGQSAKYNDFLNLRLS